MVLYSKTNRIKASRVIQGVEELVYRSNLIGTDRAVCNWGGGNTSMKTTEKDFRGRDIEVMWVKGSGSDLATMKAQNFTGLNLELLVLKKELLTSRHNTKNILNVTNMKAIKCLNQLLV